MFYYGLFHNNELMDVAVTTTQVQNRFSLGKGVVHAIMRKIDYERTSDDYKAQIDGVPYLVFMDPCTGGTVLGPVKLYDESFSGWIGSLEALGAKFQSLAVLEMKDSGYTNVVSPEVMKVVYEYWMVNLTREHIQPMIDQLTDKSVTFEYIDALFPPYFKGDLRKQWNAYIDETLYS